MPSTNSCRVILAGMTFVLQGVAAISAPSSTSRPAFASRAWSGVAAGATSAPRLKIGTAVAMANSYCRRKMSTSSLSNPTIIPQSTEIP
jgi:hypothetical protein